MSRRGNPYDNALAENFFSILKTECIYRIKLQTYEEARLLIGEYIHFYNNQRIQLQTKLTPLEKRSQYNALKLNFHYHRTLFCTVRTNWGSSKPRFLSFVYSKYSADYSRKGAYYKLKDCNKTNFPYNQKRN